MVCLFLSLDFSPPSRFLHYSSVYPRLLLRGFRFGFGVFLLSLFYLLTLVPNYLGLVDSLVGRLAALVLHLSTLLIPFDYLDGSHFIVFGLLDVTIGGLLLAWGGLTSFTCFILALFLVSNGFATGNLFTGLLIHVRSCIESLFLFNCKVLAIPHFVDNG